MVFGIALVIILAVLLWYAVWGRAWLKAKPWTQPFFTWIEPIEIALYKKSEVILFARLKVVYGIILTCLGALGTIDLTPLMPFVPEKYQGIAHVAVNLLPLLLSLLGAADEKQRNATTLPLEVVAVPDKVVAENPKIAEAVAMAVSTKTEAVAVIKEEKAA